MKLSGGKVARLGTPYLRCKGAGNTRGEEILGGHKVPE